jgi:hypothetical protein
MGTLCALIIRPFPNPTHPRVVKENGDTLECIEAYPHGNNIWCEQHDGIVILNSGKILK